jgi:Flp pilus assembly protein TadG
MPDNPIRRSAAPARAAALMRAFRRDEKAVSALEFALLLPLMITVYLASFDISLVITADRRVTSIASSIGDLVGQATQINTDEMNDIFEAATAIIQPMDAAALSIVVTSVVADEDGETTVAWSQAHNGSGETPGATFSLPNGIIQPLESVIVASVSYSYSSPLAQFLDGEQWNLDEVFYLRPRRTNQVVFNP